MSANTVHVTNISLHTGEKEIKDFFSFCGKISNLEVKSTGETKEATVTFEKETAAKTALLLDNTQLGATHVAVTSASGSVEDDGSHYTHNADRDSDDITQEEKPRSRIIAEYLAHGYVIGDKGIQRAIDLDQKHGVSSRFVSTLQSLDKKYQATDKARSVDQSYGVTERASGLWTGLNSYYEKAAETPTGQKLVNFYTQTSRQVQDIHNEARRLADLKKEEAAGKTTGTEKTTCKCDSVSDDSSCAPGHSACADRTKSEVKKVPGTTKMTCLCFGIEDNCTCRPDECACAGCAKSQT